MTAVFEYKSADGPDAWDSDLLSLGGHPHPLQSAAFGAFLRADMGRAGYVRIFRDSRLAGMCVLGIDSPGAGTWYHGPHAPGAAPEEYCDMFSGLMGHLQKRGLTAVAAASSQLVCDATYYSDPAAPPFHEIEETAYLDLRVPPDDMLAGFDRSVRKNVRKCAGAGVEIIISSEPEYLAKYFELLAAHRQKLNFPLPPFYVNAQTAPLFNREACGMNVALASVQGEFIAGLGYVHFGAMVMEAGVGQSDGYASYGLNAHDMIKVEAARHFSSMGLAYYDLAGVSRNADDAKEANIRRFKMKFATGVARFGSVKNVCFSPTKYYARKIAGRVLDAANLRRK